LLLLLVGTLLGDLPEAPKGGALTPTGWSCSLEGGFSDLPIAAAFRALPVGLGRRPPAGSTDPIEDPGSSLTSDQGLEMAEHRRLRRQRGGGLLLRPAQRLPAGLELEHQRALAPVLPAGQEPRGGSLKRGSTRSRRSSTGDPARRPNGRPPRAAQRADRRPRRSRPRALISLGLRPSLNTARASMRRSGTSGVVHCRVGVSRRDVVVAAVSSARRQAGRRTIDGDHARPHLVDRRRTPNDWMSFIAVAPP
jgi:hypothetical protein